MLFARGETDVLTLQEKVEKALYALAHGMSLNLLDTPVRERLLIALDTLSLIWEQLLQMPEDAVLPPRQAHLLYTLWKYPRLRVTPHLKSTAVQRGHRTTRAGGNRAVYPAGTRSHTAGNRPRHRADQATHAC